MTCLLVDSQHAFWFWLFSVVTFTAWNNYSMSSYRHNIKLFWVYVKGKWKINMDFWVSVFLKVWRAKFYWNVGRLVIADKRSSHEKRERSNNLGIFIYIFINIYIHLIFVCFCLPDWIVFPTRHLFARFLLFIDMNEKYLLNHIYNPV